MREQFDVGLSGEVYDTPCHRQPVFEPWAGPALPQAEHICAHHICLPVSARMTTEDAHYVIEALQKSLTGLQAEPVTAGE
jgi:dTDP-4-amino-4,6-dideoxygalactose transaminase